MGSEIGRRATVNPFRWGERQERGVAPAALVGFWLSLIGLILWGLIGGALGIHNWFVRVAGVFASAGLLVDGVVLLVGVRDSTNRTVTWLRAGGSTMLSRHSAAYWRLYGALLVFAGAGVLFRSLIP